MLLSENNIKAELSYAYLYAVASRAGCSVEVTGRHSDGAGIDAVIRAKQRFAPESVFTQFTVDVQLKATLDELSVDSRGRYAYALKLDHFNKLRDPERQAQLILVLLLLPRDTEQWLNQSTDCLVARRCAYWVSLRGAPTSSNDTSQTIYVPSANSFSVENLRLLMTQVSCNRMIDYEP